MASIELGISGDGEGVIVTAVRWIEATLLGSAATSVVILAIGFWGFAMLSGRLDLRTGARIILGAFILFGAPLIAYALMNTIRGDGRVEPNLAQASAPREPAQQVVAPDYDPYAGAAIPQPQ